MVLLYHTLLALSTPPLQSRAPSAKMRLATCLRLLLRPARSLVWLGYRGRRAVRPPVEPRRAEDMLQAPSLRVTGGFYGLQGFCRRRSVRSAHHRRVRLAYAMSTVQIVDTGLAACLLGSAQE